jgi:transcription elongation factor Elf1
MAKKTTSVWKPTHVSTRAHVRVTLDFTCPVCNKEQEATLSDATIVGGCHCRPGLDDYCYCPLPHFEEKVFCSEPTCAVSIELES